VLLPLNDALPNELAPLQGCFENRKTAPPARQIQLIGSSSPLNLGKCSLANFGVVD
jgi:hypothetical protein